MSKPTKFIENYESDLLCPQCDTPPRKLVVKTNRHTGHQFLGCPNFPDCTYTRGIPEEWVMRANGQPGLFDHLPFRPMTKPTLDSGSPGVL